MGKSGTRGPGVRFYHLNTSAPIPALLKAPDAATDLEDEKGATHDASDNPRTTPAQTPRKSGGK